MREPGIGGGACGSPETAKTDLSSPLRPSVHCAIKRIIARRTGVPPAEPVEPILQAHQLAHVVGSAQPAQVCTFMCYGTSLMSPRVSSANTW